MWRCPLILVFIMFSCSLYGQIENKKKSIAIPAVESKKDSADIKKLLPAKPIENKTLNSNLLNTPKIVAPLNLPKKEFSMLPRETYKNPGALYQKRIDKHVKSITDQLELGIKGSKTDQYFGAYTTSSKFVKVLYRDYGREDGDFIRVSVNNEIVEYRALLTNNFRGFTLELKKGKNTIDFLAINEGNYVPNTANFRIVDENGTVIASNSWALSVNVKGTVTIIKE